MLGDRYRIVGRPLGKGCTGTVYKVEDETGETYAIKRINSAIHEDKRLIDHLIMAYVDASALRHPNIVAYQEVFEVDGVWYIRMEYNEGINLRQLLRREKKIPTDLASSICRDLTRALEHLHTHNVEHCNIKPENILLANNGTVKLTDFGINPLEYTAVSRSSALTNTFRYMPIERLTGQISSDLNPANDLYALGVVYYELLTGKDPYGLSKQADLYEVINIKKSREAHLSQADINPELRNLVAKLLHRDPTQRLVHARQVGQILSKHAVSHVHQRSAFHQWIDKDNAEINSSRRLSLPQRKRDSFWEEGPPIEPPTSSPKAMPTPNPPLYPVVIAFAGTIVFLLIMWLLGLKHHYSKSNPDFHTTTQTQTIAHNVSPSPRSNLYQMRTSGDQKIIDAANKTTPALKSDNLQDKLLSSPKQTTHKQRQYRSHQKSLRQIKRRQKRVKRPRRQIKRRQKRVKRPRRQIKRRQNTKRQHRQIKRRQKQGRHRRK
jgi:serine/threonine protein kinase